MQRGPRRRQNACQLRDREDEDEIEEELERRDPYAALRGRRHQRVILPRRREPGRRSGFSRRAFGYRPAVAKLVYRPFGLLFSVLGGILAGAVFKRLWKVYSGEKDPPKAKESEYGWKEVLPAALLQGAIFGLVKAAIDRGGARAFERLTGTWPGD